MSEELEALNKYQHLMQYLYDSFEISHDFKNEYAILVQALTELEELKRDVKRYIELEGNYQKSSHEYHEMEYIKNKLMEVGNED